MAKKQAATEDKTLNALNNTLTNTGEKIIKNGKMIGWITGSMLIVALGILAYIFLYSSPRAQKAMDAFNSAQAKQMTTPNDTVAAKEYAAVAAQYDGTDAANLANLMAAEHYYEIGKYQEAISHLDKFKTGEKVMMAQAQCLKGDCYVNLKKYDDAIKAYDAALNTADGNEDSAPRYLEKKATVYDEQKQYAKALECYETIKKDYPMYGNIVSVDAYIAREKARLGK